LQVRLHLRLHPGKGFATIFGLWLRWGRLAVLRPSAQIRRSLPWWLRALMSGKHSVFLGRAHWRHGLRVPLEEHILIMAPPRTYKTSFLADVILHHPGPVIATTTKADVLALTAAARARRGRMRVFNQQDIGGVPSTFCWSPVDGCSDAATAIRRADAFAFAVSRERAYMQRRLCALYMTPVIGAVTCLDIKTGHMQQIVNAAPTVEDDDRV
jgi:hypothetical protein